MPEHAGLARAGDHFPPVGGALVAQAAALDGGRGNQRHADRFPHAVELVVADALLYQPVAVLLEEDEIEEVIQEEVRAEEAAHDGFQLKFQPGPVVLVRDGAPGQEPLRRRSERADPGVGSVADDQGLIEHQQVLKLGLVGLELVVSLPDAGALVGGILQLEEPERQAIDEDDDVRPARLLAAGHSELIDDQKVVVLRGVEINELGVVDFLLAGSIGELDFDALHQQPVEGSVLLG